jgi:hypothetical protein
MFFFFYCAQSIRMVARWTRRDIVSYQLILSHLLLDIFRITDRNSWRLRSKPRRSWSFKYGYLRRGNTECNFLLCPVWHLNLMMEKTNLLETSVDPTTLAMYTALYLTYNCCFFNDAVSTSRYTASLLEWLMGDSSKLDRMWNEGWVDVLWDFVWVTELIRDNVS